MRIQEMFIKPLNRHINGVVKADQDDDETAYQELEEYVVTNELDRHLRNFFEAYNTPRNDPSISGKVGVWISGFFGSGKSHFLKILSYLLENREVSISGSKPRSALTFFDEHKIRDAILRADISKAVNQSTDVILFNIDSKANSNDGNSAIINVFLRVFNEYQGFSGDHPHIANMERHLVERGVYEAFKDAFLKKSGKNWIDERDGFHFYQDDVEAALAAALELSDKAAHKWYEESEENFSVSIENFCHWVNEYLQQFSDDKKIVFLIDEVGQFIGSDTRLMLTLQTITENLGTICKGRAWIIVTSQADMDAVLGELTANTANDFSKIAGRFKTRLSLSSTNTDEVIQKRILLKTEKAVKSLGDIYDKKGDILKNQITFDRSGPTLKNYDSPESFVNNYPFAPYHFQLVQKVFEEIRKVGATGAHLAYGERSMLDAFQMAASAISNKSIGAMVPFHLFYNSVEGFLDTHVKRTIEQADQNNVLDEFDSKMLRTLFMIRYVDLIKGTIDNVVTLSIDEIDIDKLQLRKKIEESLQRLEKENLVTRNGDEFKFLTNEERDVTKKIKATDIASTEENKELGSLIFKELLHDKNKYRYSVNKFDYSIGRLVDGHSLDGKFETALTVEILSPLDTEYTHHTEASCIGKSGEGNGCVLIKLPDNAGFFNELKTWLKTNKFIRLNSDQSQLEIKKILNERASENQERKNRLRTTIEEMILSSELYAIGQKLEYETRSVEMLIDYLCQYLLENTYTKLKYLKVLQDDPYRELKAVLTVDDIGQLGLTLDGENGNPLAVKDLEQFISLKTTGNERVLVSDIVERFSKRPYGWPDAEILLIVGRLAAVGNISFQKHSDTLPTNEAFDSLQNSRTRRDVSIIKKRQTEEAILTQARELTRDLFTTLGPASEKELHEFYVQKLNEWLSNLKSYKSKTEVGKFPGKATIENALITIERLLSNRESYDFFQSLIPDKEKYISIESDYREVHEFYSSQLHVWQLLINELNKFNQNQQSLIKLPEAKILLDELNEIANSTRPYGELHKVKENIGNLNNYNETLLSEKRKQAIEKVDLKIQHLNTEIDRSGLKDADLSNQLLRPIQLLKGKIESEISISNIHLIHTQEVDDLFEEAIAQLEKAIKNAQEKTPKPGVVTPKPIETVSAANIANRNSERVFLETQEDVDSFVGEFKEELKKVIKSGKRIRIL